MIQGLVIGRLSTRFPEEALLRSSVLVFAVVGLGMVRAHTHKDTRMHEHMYTHTAIL